MLEENITPLLRIGIMFVLHICNNTDGNKLVILSAIALYYIYYGDNYIVTPAVYGSRGTSYLISGFIF